MSKTEARRILANADYLPWTLVTKARRVLGQSDPADEIVERAKAYVATK